MPKSVALIIYLDEGNWTRTIEDESILGVDIAEGNHITVTAKHEGPIFILKTLMVLY